MNTLRVYYNAHAGGGRVGGRADAFLSASPRLALKLLIFVGITTSAVISRRIGNSPQNIQVQKSRPEDFLRKSQMASSASTKRGLSTSITPSAATRRNNSTSSSLFFTPTRTSHPPSIANSGPVNENMEAKMTAGTADATTSKINPSPFSSTSTSSDGDRSSVGQIPVYKIFVDYSDAANLHRNLGRAIGLKAKDILQSWAHSWAEEVGGGGKEDEMDAEMRGVLVEQGGGGGKEELDAEMRGVLEQKEELDAEMRGVLEQVELGAEMRGVLEQVGDTQMRDMRAWIRASEEHRQIYEQIKHDSVTAFPEYHTELQAVAEAAEVPLEDLLLSNLRGEILQYSDPMDTTKKSCTDVFFRPPPRPARTAGQRTGEKGIILAQADELPVRDAELQGRLPRPAVAEVSSPGPLQAHNDDWDRPWQHMSYFVEVYDSSDGSFAFFSYCFPGFLPGMDFLVNRFGVTMTVNSLFPARFGVRGVGTAFLSRAVVDSRSMEEAIRVITDTRASTGGSWNVGQMAVRGGSFRADIKNAVNNDRARAPVQLIPHQGQRAPMLVNVETATDGASHVLHIFSDDAPSVDPVVSSASSSSPPPSDNIDEPGGSRSRSSPEQSSYYFHANEYRHLDLKDSGGFFSDPSTEHRLQRFQELFVPAEEDEEVDVQDASKKAEDATRSWTQGASSPAARLLNYLADQTDPVYPVFRENSSDKDPVWTEVTGLFNFEQGTLSLFEHLATNLDRVPDYVFSFSSSSTTGGARERAAPTTPGTSSTTLTGTGRGQEEKTGLAPDTMEVYQ
ncbi:unnamed protein product [Amoebophrya sp. A120]|nr:unnamed protein product [Amoebophrya sp. A120]|eukprot:GSA120T00025447001.1